MTGCVATSLAQVMNYFKYPTIGTGTAKYTTGTYKTELELDYADQAFDWDNMLDVYSSDSSEVSVPVLCDYRYNNYIYLTKSGSEYTIDVPKTRNLKITDVKIDSEFYLDCKAKVDITIENESDCDLAQGFAPIVFYNGRGVMIGESTIVSVPAGETITYPLYTSFYAISNPVPPADSNVTVKIYNPADGTDAIYRNAQSETVLKANPGLPEISVLNLTVNADINSEGLYLMPTDESLNYSAELLVKDGYFAYPMFSVLTDEEGNILQQRRTGDDISIISTGEKVVVDANVEYAQAVQGKVYTCYLAYTRNYVIQAISTPFKILTTEPSGVKSIINNDKDLSINIVKINSGIIATADTDIEELSAFDVSGRCLGQTHGNNLLLRNTGKGLIIVKAIDSTGSISVKKIIL